MMAEPGGATPGGSFDIRRIILLAGVAVVLIITLFVFLVRGCSQASRNSNGYTVVYSNLELRDAANAIARLKELAIPYEIQDEGRAIAVPKAKADEARLGLAEKNLPAGGVVGWEIFDESKLGATDFDRRIQLIRAISGELSRTIRRIQGVDDARVQIVIPETKLFAETVVPVTASVMLRVRPGLELIPEKITGIIHLVASSVENLQPENVTVIDSTGRILTAKAARAVIMQPLPESPQPEESAPSSAEIKSSLEVTPPPLSPSPPLAVKPTAAVTTSTVIPMPVTTSTLLQTTTTILLPTTTLTSIKSTTTTTNTIAAVTATTVLPGLPIRPEYSEEPVSTKEAQIIAAARIKKNMERNLSGKAQEILNRFYPINSVIVKTDIEFVKDKKGKFNTEQKPKIKKVVTVVLIDNRLDLTKQLKQATFKAVAAAVDYNKQRGDRVVLQCVPFHLASPPPEVVRSDVDKTLPTGKPLTSGFGLSLFWLRGLAWLLLLAGGGVIIYLVWQALRRGVSAKPKVTVAEPGTHPNVLESVAPGLEKATALEGIKSAVERNPEKIAELLRKWLSE